MARPKKQKSTAASSASADKLKKATKETTTKKSARTETQLQRTRATAKQLVEQHGPLTQLNDLYAPHTGSSHSISSASDAESQETTVQGHAEDHRGQAERVAQRRRVLMQLPPACLPTYVRLAEHGLSAPHCAFAAIITQRACYYQDTLVAAQSNEPYMQQD